MNFEPTVASVSLGNPGVHSITARLSAAAQAGFKNVEIVEADILEQSKALGATDADADQIEAAKFIRNLCDELGLKVRVLQPFWFYEGLLDRAEHAKRIKKLNLWMRLAAILDTQIVQIPSNWLQEGITGDIEIIVQDLVEMAELGLQQNPIISFAYEAVAWGTYIDTWQGSWDIVKRVDRPNFGLCLDTYHIAGRVWGDPTTASGKTENAEKALTDSLDEMAREVDVEKIFYIQPGDAERLEKPLLPGHPFYDKDQKPRMSWSRNARLFAYESDRGGHMPVEKIIDTIVIRMGYRGLTSAEAFSRELFDPRPEIPAEYARRAAESYAKMLRVLSQRVSRG